MMGVVGVLIAIAIFLHFDLIHGASSNPKVKITQGELKGVYMRSRGGREYSAFMGIPYAKKPERFEVLHENYEICTDKHTELHNIFVSICRLLGPCQNGMEL